MPIKIARSEASVIEIEFIIEPTLTPPDAIADIKIYRIVVITAEISGELKSDAQKSFVFINVPTPPAVIKDTIEIIGMTEVGFSVL